MKMLIEKKKSRQIIHYVRIGPLQCGGKGQQKGRCIRRCIQVSTLFIVISVRSTMTCKGKSFSILFLLAQLNGSCSVRFFSPQLFWHGCGVYGDLITSIEEIFLIVNARVENLRTRKSHHLLRSLPLWSLYQCEALTNYD